jgi:hypothetical protein
MSAGVIYANHPFEVTWINGDSGSTNVRGLIPRGVTVTGSLQTQPPVPATAVWDASRDGTAHYKFEFSCDPAAVMASLRPIAGTQPPVQGIAFNYTSHRGGGSGYLYAAMGMKASTAALPPWANALPPQTRQWLANIATASNSLARFRLVGVIG